MATKIQLRGGTAAQWTTANPILSEREVGIETDTRKFKFGDGATAWNSLAYASSDSSGTVASVTGEYVDNTDPANPVIDGIDDAIQAAIDSVTASSLGLGNVDNTSDANKPVSTAQSTAINAKVADSITDGVTTIAPSQNAVFDALSLKVDKPSFTVLTDGSTVTWDTQSSLFPEAKLTSTQSFALDMTNVASGARGILKITINTGGVVILTFDSEFTNKTQNTTITQYAFSAGTGKEYFLEFNVDGTTIEWRIYDSEWKSWTPTFTGFSIDPTTVVARYIVEGKKCTAYIYALGGTSNATTFTLTLPFAAANTQLQYARITGQNNSAATDTTMRTTVNSNIANLFVTISSAWTAAGGKACGGTITYEIA